jgi:hypothetical protein
MNKDQTEKIKSAILIIVLSACGLVIGIMAGTCGDFIH